MLAAKKCEKNGEKPEKRAKIAPTQLPDKQGIKGILFFSSSYPLLPLQHN